MKNIDVVRKMDAGELAKFMTNSNCENCAYRIEQCIYNEEMTCAFGMATWLESEADEDG